MKERGFWSLTKLTAHGTLAMWSHSFLSYKIGRKPSTLYGGCASPYTHPPVVYGKHQRRSCLGDWMSKILLQKRSLKEEAVVFRGLCKNYLEFVNKVAEWSIALVCYMGIFARKKRRPWTKHRENQRDWRNNCTHPFFLHVFTEQKIVIRKGGGQLLCSCLSVFSWREMHRENTRRGSWSQSAVT